MTETEWKQFVTVGTRTGKLATTRLDGRPHVVSIWFVLDGEDLVFNTHSETIKGRSLRRTGWASLCVDDERPPFSFVTVSGPVTLSTDSEDLLESATRIAARYMGEQRAEEFGRRNAVEGEMVVWLKADHVLAVKDLAG
ncbi:MAG TPA: PPOX class F420-dependent oxidoreductase [Solirubrobacteraceae bacterium]